MECEGLPDGSICSSWLWSVRVYLMAQCVAVGYGV